MRVPTKTESPYSYFPFPISNERAADVAECSLASHEVATSHGTRQTRVYFGPAQPQRPKFKEIFAPPRTSHSQGKEHGGVTGISRPETFRRLRCRGLG